MLVVGEGQTSFLPFDSHFSLWTLRLIKEEFSEILRNHLD